MIRRLNPDIDYLAPAALAASGASQVVVGGGVVHWSGVVAARHSAAGREFPASDVAGELAFVLDRIDACLEAADTDRRHLLTVTMFTTRLDELGPALGKVFAPWVGEHRPTLTVIGVAQLAYPQIHLEVQGSALMPD